MRIIIIVVFAFTVAIAARAQTPLPVTTMDYARQGAFNYARITNDSNGLQKKWSVSMYSGITAGVGFLNTGAVAFLPVTIGLQLNRRLNNNLYAFAGVAAAPAYFYTNLSFNNADYKNNFMTMPGLNANQLGINTRIQAGLMYVNDAKTFSVSGSIGISNGSYPFHQVTQKQPAVIGKRQ